MAEKYNSNENLVNDLSARNKTLLEEHSNLKEKITNIQLEHDSVAHDNFKKQDEIDFCVQWRRLDVATAALYCVDNSE